MTNTLSPTDPRSFFAGAVATAGAAIAAVTPDQLALTTPCPDYDVQTLLGHLLVVLDRVALLGEGGDPMALPPAHTGIAADAWHSEWMARAHRVQTAWTDPARLSAEMVLPWVTAPGAAMMAMYTAELTVHTWDLARATGQTVAWRDDVVQVALTAALQALQPGDREAGFEAMRAFMPPELFGPTFPPFRNPVAATDDAPAIDRLVAWYGRRP
ncbi:MAG: TIGR03086 family metal-binding protein [Actinomycetota bacterium]|nr:TIGR03086 family metal-binding protein [Actinomycetota bacterium]